MDDELKKKMKELALSGAASGAILGSGASFFNGAKSLRQVLRAGGLGAALAGGMSAGSGYVGHKILGADKDDDPNANTKRNALGGAVAGAASGGILGLGLKSDKVRNAILGKLEDGSLLKRTIASASKHPALAALVAAGLVGSAASYQGADEGMQADFGQPKTPESKKRFGGH
jgi:hypothetical protein